MATTLGNKLDHVGNVLDMLLEEKDPNPIVTNKLLEAVRYLEDAKAQANDIRAQALEALDEIEALCS